jgi:hypothetical protein
LTEEEIACLRRLGDRGGELAPPYPRAVLRTLCSHGLIEPVVLNWLPLEMSLRYYRLTAKGEALLRQNEPH